MFASQIETDSKDEKKGGDLKTEIKEYITHHLKAVSYTHLTLPTKA